MAETADAYAFRKGLGVIVERRQSYLSALRQMDAASYELRFLILVTVLLLVPALTYLAVKGLHFFSVLVAGIGVYTVGKRILRMDDLTLRRRQLVRAELETEPAYRKYLELQSGGLLLDGMKQRLLERQILPKLRQVMEQKLPYLMQRRFEIASFLHGYRLSDLESEVGSLEQRVKAEPDAELREALSKHLALIRARRDHFLALERSLRLHQVHLDNLQAHLENLRARVVMLDPNDDLGRVTDAILHNLTEEVEFLEVAYRELSR
jgi:hypothetical protein